jgi:hypothetical protein
VREGGREKEGRKEGRREVWYGVMLKWGRGEGGRCGIV